MNKQLDEIASDMLRQFLEDSGIRVCLDTSIAAIEGSEKISGIKFSDGTFCKADMVILITGVRYYC